MLIFKEVIMNSNNNLKEFWVHHFEEWERSNLAKDEYCRRNAISKQSFYKWQKILRPDLITGRGGVRKKQHKKIASDFLVLKEKKFSSNNFLTLSLEGEVILSFSSPPDPEWLSVFCKVYSKK